MKMVLIGEDTKFAESLVRYISGGYWIEGQFVGTDKITGKPIHTIYFRSDCAEGEREHNLKIKKE